MSENKGASASPALSPPLPEGTPPVRENSANEAAERILQEGFWEHGRFYGSWKPWKYLWPIDKEELNRLDIFHKCFLVARGGTFCSRSLPKDRPPRILDLGTGTGIWAINVAEDHVTLTDIVAVDLNQIQPPLIPPGMTTMQFDLEDASWDPLPGNCDLIHMRMLLGSIRDNLWAETYHKIFQHLLPGEGYLEHVEVDWTPRWEGPEHPPQSALVEWSEAFFTGMDRFNRSVRVKPEETKRMLEAAGFTEITETATRCYVNPWSPERDEREVARWFNLGLTLGLEAMSLMPLVENLGMTKAQVSDLCHRARDEACILRYHAYCTIYAWTAKRPPNKPQ